MRWKLIRRRLSVSAPRVMVRSHLPWPLRWAVVAVMLGFSAALSLWAFEFGREIAGIDRVSKDELQQLRLELARLRESARSAQAIADTADSLLKAERAAQERLAQQVRQLEAERQELRANLGFFENLLTSSGDGLQLRGLQAQAPSPGRLRYQMLLVQAGKDQAPFDGRYELMLTGTMAGKPWSQALPGGPRPVQFRQYTRVEGDVEHPDDAVVKSIQARVTDRNGAIRATQSLRL